jgi:hypothetical protein
MANGQGRGDDEKSWAEIAEEVADVAKDVAKKVGGGVSKVIKSIVPSSTSTKTRQAPERRVSREDAFIEEAFKGTGFMGRMAGRAVGSLFKGVMSQLKEAQEEMADVQARASQMVENSERVRAVLGAGIRCLPSVSQSSSRSIVNGRSTERVLLVMPVADAAGRRVVAQARVEYSSASRDASEVLKVFVDLPNGTALAVDGGGGSGGKGTIVDVEWKSVDD